MSPRTSKVASSASVADEGHLKHKRRFCRQDGCNRIVKSQGLCQRHGAKPRKCKVDGCDKQAQGNFDKMCKSHFKAMKRVTTPLPRVRQGKAPPAPQGFSVYDGILPASIAYAPRKGTVMPLIAHLKDGFASNKPPAWHRNEERNARGILPVENPATQLEGWERELVWMEILVLTGAPDVSFRHLARAWGRDKGFHTVLAQFICERQGDVQRKKRLAEKEEEAAASGKSRGPAKKRRRKKNANLAADVSADIWDDSAYGDHVTNEALAADIFDFSPKEFESATALQRWKHMEEHSDSASMTSQRSINSHAAAAIMLEHSGKIMPKPSAAKENSSSDEHPEQNAETSALVLTSDSNNSQGGHPQFHNPPGAAPAAGPMVPHGQQSHQQSYQQQGHQQQYAANVHQQVGQPGQQQQYVTNVHHQDGLSGHAAQYEQNQNPPNYDTNVHQQQAQHGHQPPHYDASAHHQQGHQHQYAANVHQQVGQPGHQQQYTTDVHQHDGLPGHAAQYEQSQNPPHYDSNVHQQQAQQPQYEQNHAHYDASAHQPQGHQPQYSVNVQQQQGQPGHLPQYEQNQTHYDASSHQQNGQFHQPAPPRQQEPQYQNSHEQLQHNYPAAPQQQYGQVHGSAPVGGALQGHYMAPAGVQNQTHYTPAHGPDQQQHFPQQHGQSMNHQGHEIHQHHTMSAPSQEQHQVIAHKPEHPEHDPETSAVPPELAHPHGHHQQYQ